MAFADLTQQVLLGHAAIVEDDGRGRRPAYAHLLFFRAGLEAGEFAFHDESRELFAINLGKDDVDVSKAAIGDPHLFAVEYPFFAVTREYGLGARVHGIRG